MSSKLLPHHPDSASQKPDLLTSTPNSQLLIALPCLSDPQFSQSVTLMCEHTSDGALGLVVNRPSGNTLDDTFNQLDLPCPDHLKHRTVYQGGPVGLERGFVLHNDDSEWRNTLSLHSKKLPTKETSLNLKNSVHKPLKLTTSLDIIQAVSQNQGPEQFMLIMGFAGWEHGQLEREMQQNIWITTEVEPALLFNTPPEHRWQMAIDSLGFRLAQLNPSTGRC